MRIRLDGVNLYLLLPNLNFLLNCLKPIEELRNSFRFKSYIVVSKIYKVLNILYVLCTLAIIRFPHSFSNLYIYNWCLFFYYLNLGAKISAHQACE